MRILVVVGALWCVACFARVEPDPAPPVEPDASQPCTPRLAADGVRRCLPTGVDGEEYFRPSLCGAAPLAVVPAGTRAAYVLTSAVVPHLDAPPWTRVFDGSRPSLDVSVCQWHGAACACRPVREGEAVYATELPPTAFPAAP